MSQKCTHKGCEKTFTDPEEPCYYHPGAPIFHEGQKGWQCCKPRVLTFDEFMTIPPCTTGKHSTTAPILAPVQTSGNLDPALAGSTKHPEVAPPSSSKPLPTVTPRAPVAPKADKPLPQDPENAVIPAGTKCTRSGCNAVAPNSDPCVFHPGVPIFHEGSKGYVCCKRRVLEFDEFLKIPGCAENRHCFLGEQKGEEGEEEKVECRNDFYQTYEKVIVSIFAKKVVKGEEKVSFGEETLNVDLKMEGRKRFVEEYPLYGKIDPAGCSYKVMGTKVELVLKKADSTSWPTLRNDEETGEIIQIGQPARA